MYYNVHINGQVLSKDRLECIESITVEENCDGSDTCTIVVSDPEFKYIEDNIFIEEATVYIEFGWNEETYRQTFFGFISAIDINFPENGYPQLYIYCLDNSHVMNRKKKTRTWSNVNNADVVKKIAAEYGFACKIQGGYYFEKQDTISQSGVTDIEFCENLARGERELFMCKLIGNTLTYVKKGLLASPSATVYYKDKSYDVINFSPRINKETRLEEVTAADINTDTKKTTSAVANNSNTAREVQGEPVKTNSKPTSPTSSSSGSTPVKSYKYDPKTGQWIAV